MNWKLISVQFQCSEMQEAAKTNLLRNILNLLCQHAVKHHTAHLQLHLKIISGIYLQHLSSTADPVKGTRALCSHTLTCLMSLSQWTHADDI